MADAASRAWLERRGLRALSAERALLALDDILVAEAPDAVTVVADVDWSVFRVGFEAWGHRALLDALDVAVEASAEAAVERRASLAQTLADLPAEERPPYVREWLRSLCAAILGHHGPEDVSFERGFFEMGMDSLSAVQFRRRLEKALERRVSATVTFEHPNVTALATHILKELGMEPRVAPAAAARPDDAAPTLRFDSEADALRFIDSKFDALGDSS
jgi:hypothetical protein